MAGAGRRAGPAGGPLDDVLHACGAEHPVVLPWIAASLGPCALDPLLAEASASLLRDLRQEWLPAYTARPAAQL